MFDAEHDVTCMFVYNASNSELYFAPNTAQKSLRVKPMRMKGSATKFQLMPQYKWPC